MFTIVDGERSRRVYSTRSRRVYRSTGVFLTATATATAAAAADTMQYIVPGMQARTHDRTRARRPRRHTHVIQYTTDVENLART